MTAWIDPTIDVKLEVAFSTDPLATTPTWTDVTPYLRDIPSITRGATSEDTTIGTGFATFVFDNRDRRFDPDHASSPYSPNVKPMRRVRLTVTKTSAVVTFTGFVLSWTNDWTVDDGVSVVRCVDSMWWLANKPLDLSTYETTVMADSPMAYWRTMSDKTLIDMVGGPTLGALARSNYVITYTAPDVLQTDIGYPLGDGAALWDQFVTAEGPASPPRAFEFWVKTEDATDMNFNVFTGSETQEFMSFFYSDLLGTSPFGINLWIQSSDLSVEYDTRLSWEFDSTTAHHVAVWFDATNATVMIDGLVQFTIAAGALPGAGAGARTYMSATAGDSSLSEGGLGHVAVYSTAPSSTRFRAHHEAGRTAYGGSAYKERGGARITRVLDDIGWSSSLRSLDTGNFRHGAYLPAGQQALDYIRAVVDIERGLFFADRTGALNFLDIVAMTGGAATGKVFSDDGGAGAIKYAALRMSPASAETVRNIVTVSYSTVGGITRRDATSEGENGSSQLFIDGPTLALARDASSIAGFELDQRKDPTTRVESITVYWRNGAATDTTNAVDTLSAVDIGDIVTVEITPMGVGSQVVKLCQVIGIEHEIAVDRAQTTLYMRPAYDQSGWFTLGTSALDGTDVLLP